MENSKKIVNFFYYPPVNLYGKKISDFFTSKFTSGRLSVYVDHFRCYNFEVVGDKYYQRVNISKMEENDSDICGHFYTPVYKDGVRMKWRDLIDEEIITDSIKSINYKCIGMGLFWTCKKYSILVLEINGADQTGKNHTYTMRITDPPIES